MFAILFSFWLCLLCYGDQNERDNVKYSVAPGLIFALDISNNLENRTLQGLKVLLKRSITHLVEQLDSVRIISTKCCHSNLIKAFEDCVSSFSFHANRKGNLVVLLEKALQSKFPCEKNIAGFPEGKMHQTINNFLVLFTNAAERKENYKLLEKATENEKVRCAVVYIGGDQQRTQDAQDDLLRYLKSRVASSPQLFFEANTLKRLNSVLLSINAAAKNVFEKKRSSEKLLALHNAATTESNSLFSLLKLGFKKKSRRSSQRMQQGLMINSTDEQKNLNVQNPRNRHDIPAGIHRRVSNANFYENPASTLALSEANHIIPNKRSNHAVQNIWHNEADFPESRLIRAVAENSIGITNKEYKTNSFHFFDTAKQTSDTVTLRLSESERFFANDSSVFLYLDRLTKSQYKYGFWTPRSMTMSVLLLLLFIYLLLRIIKPIFRRIALLKINRTMFTSKASTVRC